jgi:hypothetical protein
MRRNWFGRPAAAVAGKTDNKSHGIAGLQVVFRQEESFNYDHPPRGPHVYYTLNPLLIDYLRLHARST